MSVEEVIVAFFQSGPWWFHRLLALRNALVRPLGLKTGAATAADIRPPFRVGQAIGVFRIMALAGDEVVFGEDDRHLDFRLSLLLRWDGAGNSLVLSTLVRINNGLGTGYFAVVKPFHRLIVPIMARGIAQHLQCAGKAA